MSRRNLTNAVWLTLGGLFIATGANVALAEGWAVSVLIAAVIVGGASVPLLTWGGAAKVLADSDPEAVAELRAAIRKEITR